MEGYCMRANRYSLDRQREDFSEKVRSRELSLMVTMLDGGLGCFGRWKVSYQTRSPDQTEGCGVFILAYWYYRVKCLFRQQVEVDFDATL
jgi:hypothetical protein